MRTNSKPVAVLGAGLAGLTAAVHLHRSGVPVILYEAGPHVAGLARSHHDADGFTYDFGAHFITNRLAEALGVLDQCRDVPRYGETVFLNGQYYGYPFGLMRIPRFVSSAVRSKLGRRPEPTNAAQWYRKQYGDALANEVAIPLTEAWSGVPAEDLAASLSESFSNSIARTLYLKLAGKIKGKAVACGYSRELPEEPGVWHVYPEGGVGLLCQKLAAELGGCIRLKSPVKAVFTENDRVTAVEAGDQTDEVSAVISTAPLPALAKMMRGTDALEPFARFRYRPMTFVNMRLEGRGLLPDVVIWTPEKKFPFFRLTETPLSMPWLAPEGKTLVTVDIGCEVGDDIWKKPDEALGEFCLDPLASLIPDVRDRYRGCRVLRTPFAYPVYHRDYEADRLRLRKGRLGVRGLHVVGRNGEFMHIFMEDVYQRALRKAAEVAAEVCTPRLEPAGA